MGISIGNSIPPQTFRFLMMGACVLGLYATWDVLQSKVQELRYLPVLGEQSHSQAVAERDELQSLPIVMARNEYPVDEVGQISDEAIEAAFNTPVVEVDEPEPVKFNMAQQLIMRFRPVVSALSTNGAVINGQFWSVGESIANMPLRASDGRIVTPSVASVGSVGVVLAIEGETVNLTFNH